MNRRAASTPGAGPTVLLIDDEESVRLPLRLSLEHSGYRVIEACDGRSGLEVLSREGEEIALVVVDHQMPHLSGTEMMRELRHRRAIPVILMSGLSAVETGVIGSRPDAFLRKPFDLVELARAVRRLIGPGEPRPKKSCAAAG